MTIIIIFFLSIGVSNCYLISTYTYTVVHGTGLNLSHI